MPPLVRKCVGNASLLEICGNLLFSFYFIHPFCIPSIPYNYFLYVHKKIPGICVSQLSIHPSIFAFRLFSISAPLPPSFPLFCPQYSLVEKIWTPRDFDGRKEGGPATGPLILALLACRELICRRRPQLLPSTAKTKRPIAIFAAQSQNHNPILQKAPFSPLFPN